MVKMSLVTVCFNSESTIKTTLDSVADQDFPSLEYIVVDGGSTDATLQILKNYSRLQIQFQSEPDDGIYDAMNKGIALCTGDIVGVLNSDDYYAHSNVLTEVVETFGSDEGLDAVLGDVEFVDYAQPYKVVRRYLTGRFKPWMFRWGLMPPHPGVFVRKTAYDRVGTYKLGYKIAADFDFLIRLMLLDRCKFKIVNRIWVRMRTGGVSTSGLKSNMISTEEMKRSLQENGLFASNLMLLCRLPFKLITQVFRK